VVTLRESNEIEERNVFVGLLPSKYFYYLTLLLLVVDPKIPSSL